MMVMEVLMFMCASDSVEENVFCSVKVGFVSLYSSLMLNP